MEVPGCSLLARPAGLLRSRRRGETSQYRIREKTTAAQGAALELAVDQALGKLTTAKRGLKDLGTAWDTAFAALADEEWSLIKILQATLNDDDTRWLEFGLTMPSQSSTPGQPTGLTV